MRPLWPPPTTTASQSRRASSLSGRGQADPAHLLGDVHARQYRAWPGPTAARGRRRSWEPSGHARPATRDLGSRREPATRPCRRDRRDAAHLPGRIDVLEGGRMRAYGRPGSGLHAQVTINDPARLVGPLRGSLGLGEAYADGLWETDDLVSLLRIGARELRRAGRRRRGCSPARAPWSTGFAASCRRTPAAGRGENISAHYDLGNELFSAFLDPADDLLVRLLRRPEASLEEAQLAKLDRICAQLRLAPRRPPAGDRHRLGRPGDPRRLALRLPGDDDDDLPPSSTRWRPSGCARPASRTGSTLLLEDYRDLRGRYDKLVSIEMIEAVGWQYFDELLRPLQRPARARRADVAAGDRHRRPPLRGREGGPQLRQHPHLPRRLPAVERG